MLRLLVSAAVVGFVGPSTLIAVPATAVPAAAQRHVGPAFRAGARFNASDPKARVRPSRYTAYSVDPDAVRAQLAAAPTVNAGPTAGRRPGSGATFSVPTPSGGTERFSVVRTEVMQPQLAAAHPEISTWAGRSVDHPGATIALDLTPMGFHASVLGDQSSADGGHWLVDPAYNRPGTTTELAYDESAVARTSPAVEREGETLRAASAGALSSARTSARRGGRVTQRVYRLALTSDPTYAAYFGTDNVLAEKVTLVNRVDQVYNDDLAVWLQLVDGEDLLNLDTDAKATGADGPCGAHACFDGSTTHGLVRSGGQLDSCGLATLGRNRTVIGQLIGASNYDVGHIVLGGDGGGLSDIGVVGADYKAGGCTGIATPQGDLFALDYLAHELGHEFGGTHDFNGYDANCGGSQHNRRASVEPGSGSSVMAYAGICGSDDLQPHSDPYFSQFSQRQLGDYVRSRAPGVNEVQTVSLRGFDQPGDQITLGYPSTDPDSPATRTLTLGSTYTAAGIADAVQALTGHQVSVGQWGYDPLDHALPSLRPPTAPDDTGFQVIFAASNDPLKGSGYGDLASLTVTSSSPGVSGFVGETAQGGPARNGGSAVATANHAPVVHAPKSRMLPIRTPFRLTAHGSDRDGDGDHLTYSWEQNDRGSKRGTRLLDPHKVFGPLFRIFGTAAEVTRKNTLKTPSPGENIATGSDKVRYFPDLAQVLSRDTDARTGTCPATSEKHRHQRVVDCYSEFLPTADYVGDSRATSPRMRFVVTARDGSPGGGGVDQARVTLKLDPDAGPFLVTSEHGRGVHYAAGATMPVTWAVNGTRPLAASVSVLLSTDGGRSWEVVQGRTANDGRTAVRLPRTSTGTARIMVRARGNFFYAVNDQPFAIGARRESAGS